MNTTLVPARSPTLFPSAVELRISSQNLLLRFVRDGTTHVLRRPPRHKRSNSDETMRREARILSALAGSDVPHPTLVAAESDESVLGASFYLMTMVDGFVPTVGMPSLHAGDPGIRYRMGLSFVDAAAALAAVDHIAVGLGDFGRVEGYLERQVPRWRSQLESFSRLDGYPGPDIPHLTEVGDWLEANCPLSSSPGLIHGDFHLGNVMFHNKSPDVVAVLDWELATVGDPLVDVGLILAMWPEPGGKSALMSVEPWEGFPSATDLLDRYRQVTGRDMSMVEWYTVLACFKTGIILEGTFARALSGQASREMGDLLHAVTLMLFERGWSIIKSVG